MRKNFFTLVIFFFALGFLCDAHAQGVLVDPTNYGPDTVYTKPEEDAEFPGGREQMISYIDLKFDSKAEGWGDMGGLKAGSGFIEANFVVEVNGKVKYVLIERGISSTYDEELKRALLTMPKWKPAVHDGKKVRSLEHIRYVLNFAR